MPKRMIKVASPQVGEAEVAAVREVLLSGRFMSGPKVEAFERAFADYIGVEHAIAVNSGTAALHVSLACADIGPGDEVIVPSLTFFSTVTAVIHQRGVPVFADISLDNYCLDPDDIEQRITSRTKAIIPVHFLGHAAEMEAINEIVDRHSITVIEDSAQAHGTIYKQQRVGAIGHMGAFSFFATKHMTTGEGGAITTNNPIWAKKAKMLRNHGLEGRNDHVILGYNYRMSEIAAAMGIVQLDKLDHLNEARIRNSEYLLDQLRDIPWLTSPKVPDYVVHTYFWCPILVDEEKLGFSTQTLIAELRIQGIEVRHRYLEPLYRQPILFKENSKGLLNYDNVPDYHNLHFPNVERVAGKVIGLPNRPDMSHDEIRYVADILHSF